MYVFTFTVSIGRNQPLRPEKPKWKSDVPLTEGQLRSKRDEFWDTAPAFEGRKEIWDALKAAAYALETGDHTLAQAIIDGASITLPHGEKDSSYIYYAISSAIAQMFFHSKRIRKNFKTRSKFCVFFGREQPLYGRIRLVAK